MERKSSPNIPQKLQNLTVPWHGRTARKKNRNTTICDESLKNIAHGQQIYTYFCIDWFIKLLMYCYKFYSCTKNNWHYIKAVSWKQTAVIENEKHYNWIENIQYDKHCPSFGRVWKEKKKKRWRKLKLTTVRCKIDDQLSDLFVTFTVSSGYKCVFVHLCVCAFPSADSLNWESYLKWFWPVNLSREYSLVAKRWCYSCSTMKPPQIIGPEGTSMRM